MTNKEHCSRCGGFQGHYRFCEQLTAARKAVWWLGNVKKKDAIACKSRIETPAYVKREFALARPEEAKP